MHSTLYEKHVSRGSPQWLSIRQEVLDRAGYRCERCRDLASLEVHHKHYQTLGREQLP